jgi:hypothetical protein
MRCIRGYLRLTAESRGAQIDHPCTPDERPNPADPRPRVSLTGRLVFGIMALAVVPAQCPIAVPLTNHRNIPAARTLASADIDAFRGSRDRLTGRRSRRAPMLYSWPGSRDLRAVADMRGHNRVRLQSHDGFEGMSRRRLTNLLYGGSSPEPRAISRVGTTTVRAGDWSPSIRAKSLVAAMWPIALGS